MPMMTAILIVGRQFRFASCHECRARKEELE